MTNLDNTLQKKRHHFAENGPSSQSYVFFLVAMLGCESWTMKKAEHWRTDAFELWCWIRLLKVPGLKDMKPVNPKEINLKYIGRTDTKAEAPILWPPDMKSQVIGKDPDAGKI